MSDHHVVTGVCEILTPLFPGHTVYVAAGYLSLAWGHRVNCVHLQTVRWFNRQAVVGTGRAFSVHQAAKDSPVSAVTALPGDDVLHDMFNAPNQVLWLPRDGPTRSDAFRLIPRGQVTIPSSPSVPQLQPGACVATLGPSTQRLGALCVSLGAVPSACHDPPGQVAYAWEVQRFIRLVAEQVGTTLLRLRRALTLAWLAETMQPSTKLGLKAMEAALLDAISHCVPGTSDASLVRRGGGDAPGVLRARLGPDGVVDAAGGGERIPDGLSRPLSRLSSTLATDGAAGGTVVSSGDGTEIAMPFTSPASRHTGFASSTRQPLVLVATAVPGQVLAAPHDRAFLHDVRRLVGAQLVAVDRREWEQARAAAAARDAIEQTCHQAMEWVQVRTGAPACYVVMVNECTSAEDWLTVSVRHSYDTYNPHHVN